MSWKQILRSWGPQLSVAAFLLLLAGHLLDPARVLDARDFPQFHLPLRAALMRLASFGLPEWNPWVGGGQPILSDPSYSVFYPVTWLAAVVPVAWAYSLSVLLHLVVAASGAFLLARRLGVRPAVAAFAAIVWSGSGFLLSYVQAFTLFTGGAWLSWILLASDRLARASDRDETRRWRLLLAVVFALTLLNGEPVTVLCGGLAAGCLAFGRARGRELPRALARVAGAALIAALLAAVQLAPALARLERTSRSAGLDRAKALGWSMPPERLLELVEPRIWGDPLRLQEGLFFGWGIHDQDFPFAVSLTPALLVLVLACAALLRWPIAGRRGWIALGLGGLALALGRHTPIYGWLYDFVPPFSALRYPEKFVLLCGVALAFAAALGVEHLLRERERGRPGVADFPVALASIAFGVAGAIGAVVFLSPSRTLDFVAAHLGLPMSERTSAQLLAFCRTEASIALAFAAATVTTLALARWRRIPAPAILAALILLAGADLLLRNRELLRTASASLVEREPRIAGELDRETRIVWASTNYDRRPELYLRPRPGERVGGGLRQAVERMDPWSGVIWGWSYPLSTDYALTYTAPARRAVALTAGLWRRRERERLFRLLGAWGVTRTLVPRGADEILAARRAGDSEPALARVGPSPFALPRVRTVRAAESHATVAAATSALLASTEAAEDLEFLAGAPWSGRRQFDPAARVTGVEDRGDTLSVSLEGRGPTLLVVATSWDPFWSASADGVGVPVLESATGYLAVPLPAGARRVSLRYRDPWVRVGAAVSATTLLGLLALALRRRRRLA